VHFCLHVSGKNSNFRNGFPGFEEWRKDLMLSISSEDEEDDDDDIEDEGELI
jgi:hypothetical protein